MDQALTWSALGCHLPMMDMFSRRPGTRELVAVKPFPMKEFPIDFNRMAEFLIHKKSDLKNEMLVYDTMIQYEIT